VNSVAICSQNLFPLPLTLPRFFRNTAGMIRKPRTVHVDKITTTVKGVTASLFLYLAGPPPEVQRRRQVMQIPTVLLGQDRNWTSRVSATPYLTAWANSGKTGRAMSE